MGGFLFLRPFSGTSVPAFAFLHNSMILLLAIIALKIQKLEADLVGLESLITKFNLLKNGLLLDLLTGQVPVTPLLENSTNIGTP